MSTMTFLIYASNVWQGDHDPSTSESPEFGILSANDLYMNNITYDLFQCLNPTLGSQTWLKRNPMQSDWNESSTGMLDYIKNKPTIPSILPAVYSSPTFSSITTATQLSTTRDAYVNYVFPTSLTSLLANQTLTATLQYADDSGMNSNLVTVNSDVTGCSGILSLTLSGRLQVSGRIPSGKYRKVTLSQTGGATVPTTISSSQEVLL